MILTQEQAILKGQAQFQQMLDFIPVKIAHRECMYQSFLSTVRIFYVVDEFDIVVLLSTVECHRAVCPFDNSTIG